MRFYVINLDRSPDRWAAIQIQFAKFRLSPTRVEAVDGQCLPADAKNHYRRGIYADLSDDEIACFLSHRRCWKLVQEGYDDYACILEDDVDLSPMLLPFVKSKIWEKFPLLSIEKFNSSLFVDPKPAFTAAPFTVYRCLESNPGSAGYVLSKRQASILLKHSEHFYHLVDSFLFCPRRPLSYRYKSFQLSPAVCMQSQKRDGKTEKPEFTTLIRRHVEFAPSVPLEVKDSRYYRQRTLIYLHHYYNLLRRKKVEIEFVDG